LGNEGNAVVIDEFAVAPPSSRKVALALIAVLLCAMLFLYYGPNDSYDIVSITALIAIPAAIGGLITQAVDPFGRLSPMGCFAWPTIFLLALTGFAYVVLNEGAVCIAMVLPIWIPAAVLGGLVQYLNARRRRFVEGQVSTLNAYSWCALPMLLIAWDKSSPAQWTDTKVVRSLEIDAAVEEVWPHIASIRNISTSEGLSTFTHDVVGIPRPSQALLVQETNRVVRKAQWGSSARFEEVVQSVVPGQEMKWAFSFPDKSIQHHTDRHISPVGPYLRIVSGGYQLVPISKDRTRLILTTSYRMKVWMVAYFGWWGEQMLGDIQNNVLAIVKGRVANSARLEK